VKDIEDQIAAQKEQLAALDGKGAKAGGGAADPAPAASDS
jgi:hypothetical protein